VLAWKGSLRAHISAALAPGFGFNQENRARADGHMVNVSNFIGLQIVESANSAVGCLV